MRTFLRAAWTEDDGVLSFEWVLIITVVVIGIVGGLAAARDAIIDELGDSAEAMLALDQSFAIDFPLLVGVNCDDPDARSNQTLNVCCPAANEVSRLVVDHVPQSAVPANTSLATSTVPSRSILRPAGPLPAL